MTDQNDAVIKEFHDNNGRVGGYFAGANLVLLTTTGAKSGEKRTAPVMSFTKDGAVYVIASKAGADTNPAWYHNMLANPSLSVELATDSGIDAFEATAVPLPEPERSELYAEIGAKNPGFAAYQEQTSRLIPIVELRRA
jgi:deazaflavin-dependent oxidoreductase (nitroreductase family)